MLGITTKLEISASLTPQVRTIICHYMTKVLLKEEKIKKIKKYGGTRPITRMLTKTIHR